MVKKLLFTLAAFFVGWFSAFAQEKYIDSLTDWLQTHKVDSLWVLNAHRVSYRLSETNVQQSFAYYEKVSSASDSLHFVYGKALAQINLALLLFNSANFVASNEAYFKAIAYAEQGNYTRLVAVSLNNIGENFKTLKDFDKCREYTWRAIAINQKFFAENAQLASKTADTLLKKVATGNAKSGRRGIAVNYELLHQCDMDEKRYSSAWKNLQAGIRYALESKDSYIISQYYTGFGRLYTIFHQLDSASYYFNEALAQAKEEGDLRNEFNVYLSRAASMPSDNVQQRIRDLKTALFIAHQTVYTKGVADAAEQLLNTYDLQQNKDSAFRYFHMYRAASDTLFSENNKRNVIIKESEWLLRKKDIENNHLKSVADLQKQEIVTKNSLLIGGGVMLVLAIASGVLAFTSIRSKKRRIELEKQRQEAELKSRITDMEFKAFKAQLNPHFIFNYLNSVSGYILLSQPEKASGMIKRFSKMLRNVLKNSELNEVSLSEDIKTIERYVELMHEIATPPFSYQINVTETVRQCQKSVPPLFIQPYVENAIVHGLKHAEGDNLFLNITYRQKGEGLEVEITDNGTGFDKKKLRYATASTDEVHLGLSVTEKRIQVFSERNAYNASVCFTTLAPNTASPGTKVTVVIKNFFCNEAESAQSGMLNGSSLNKPENYISN